MRKLFTAVMFLFTLDANAYKIYEARTYHCEDGHVLGLISWQDIGIAAVEHPRHFAGPTCDVKISEGFRMAPGKGMMLRDQAQEKFSECVADNTPWVSKCSEEVKQKCRLPGGELDIAKCFGLPR